MDSDRDHERDLSRQHWDAIVVGTGMGGATLGHALAKAGMRVLFCERGHYHRRRDDAVRARYPEQEAPDGSPSAAMLARAGRCDIEWIDVSRAPERRFVPFVGSGAGGSSALYGMALERLFPADFAPRAAYPEATEAALVEAWPISYETLSPYYAAAEDLYRLRGSVDPLRPAEAHPARLLPPPALSAGGDELFGILQSRGLHPYRLPQACEYVEGCIGCQGFLCARECKNDSERICLTPALQRWNAEVLDQCEVVGLDAGARSVEQVVCRREGRELNLRGRIVALAAGAVQTPNLLLRSRSGAWPHGLANRSGLVGRNLMRHFVDLYCIETEASAAPGFDNRFKEIGCNDFYASPRGKLGTLQSFGRLPPAATLFASLRDDLAHGPFRGLAKALPLARPFVMPTLNKLVGATTVFASIAEDLPYESNRVLPAQGHDDPNSARIEYRIRPHERARIEAFRKLVPSALGRRRWRFVGQAENNLRLAHVCGTCRFGVDPRSSVLDEYNRTHDVANLFVVDASFFPSSGGTNPALTIAANALRVARHIIASR